MSGAELIIQEINREAERKIEYILNEAREEAEKIKEEAKRRAESKAEWILRRAKTQAELEKQRIIANARLEVRRKRLAVQEEIIRNVLDEVRKRLQEMPEEEYFESIKALLKEAVEELKEGKVRVYSNERTLALISSRIEEIRDYLGSISIEIGSAISTMGGVIVETEDGRIRIDNTFEARMERFEGEIRAKIAKVLFGG
ncbi:V-type ATP synthase subunit E [Pyrococcus abyssi]|uniref:A-type ATP synthase subunit E n=1 Tax=Pyrococcus abyssi (strain GE5 / Orsay) TaxID=272844 RepID=AATE_PYRAB|nr:V-type ATP synthase subunit E [Pyrococcus abyssi]Q9UXU4.1 RecName: Full=V-type ATP synthase subunit E; AltName: Full=V-ATPase subunit E [Pyrococcus abyssi GE5]CAB50669.1 atpE archaeal/vacuolar-type H+-transporting ATP synthase, subunit E [Pyrococcus abyssi GE5]CCE71238.1 TPA: V-type ATP synthase subunit E [Pyrococcus abyssi GE5]